MDTGLLQKQFEMTRNKKFDRHTSLMMIKKEFQQKSITFTERQVDLRFKNQPQLHFRCQSEMLCLFVTDAGTVHLINSMNICISTFFSCNIFIDVFLK
jgi:hypothetical protein